MKKSRKNKVRRIALELQDGIKVWFRGSDDVLGGLIDLIAMGLWIEKIKIPKKSPKIHQVQGK